MDCLSESQGFTTPNEIFNYSPATAKCGFAERRKLEFMLQTTSTNLVNEFVAYIKKNGGSYSQWYVGIAADPRKRLFIEHNVREQSDAWVHGDAGSCEAAREIERYFIEVLKTSGGGGGGDASTRLVYAYRKEAHTRP